jgi:hypothetical protein
MLGLPQSLFFYVHRSTLSIPRAMSLATLLAIAGAVGGAAYALLSLQWVNGSAICFSVAVAALVWQGSLRALVLAVVSSRAFNLVTALPQGLVLVYALMAIIIGRATYFSVTAAFAASYFAAGVVCVLMVRPVTSLHVGRDQEAVPLGTVLQYGLASGLAAVGSTLSLLLALRVVLWRLGATDLGIFSLAGVFAQGALVPLNYVVPLLFKRWMQPPAMSVPLLSGMLAASGLCVLAASVYIVGTCSVCESKLGIYSPITEILWILLLGSAADACNRIVAVAANAAGRPWFSTITEGTRLAVVAMGFTLLPTERMSDVSWIVCGAAFLAALVIITLHCIYEKRTAHAL